VTNLFETIISNEVFTKKTNEIKTNDGVTIRSKESLHYYETFRENVGILEKTNLKGNFCPDCTSKITENSKKRLKIMESTNDGFVVSDEDLKIRGPGEFFGIKQSGFIKYRIADMINDGPILRDARKAAFGIVKEDLNLEKSENSLIRNYFINEYQDKLHETNIS